MLTAGGAVNKLLAAHQATAADSKALTEGVFEPWGSGEVLPHGLLVCVEN
jgi:hypothetical protein